MLRRNLTTCLLLTAITFSHAADTPAQAALDFVEAIKKNNKKTIEKTTALTNQVGEKKRKLIYDSWNEINDEMLDLPFSVITEQKGAENAAVIVQQTNFQNVEQSKLFSIALVRSGNIWLAAPVLGSFENSIVSYDDKILAERDKLAEWMLHQEANSLTKLRENSNALRKQELEKTLPLEKLKQMSPDDLLESFFTACKSHNAPAIAAHLGMHNNPPPDDLLEALPYIHKVCANDKKLHYPWGVLLDSSAITAGKKFEGDEEDGFSKNIAFLSSSSFSNVPEYYYFDVKKSTDGLYYIELHDDFYNSTEKEHSDPEVIDLEIPENHQLYVLLWQKVKVHALEVKNDSPESLKNSIVKSLDSNDFPSFWFCGALPPEQAHVNDNMPNLNAMWHELRGQVSRDSIVGILETPNDAVIVYRALQKGNSDFIKLRQIYMQKSPQGWLLKSDSMKMSGELKAAYKTKEAEWIKQAKNQAFANIEPIKNLVEKSPDEKSVRDTFQKWNTARMHSRISEMFSLSANLNNPSSLKDLIKNTTDESTYPPRESTILAFQKEGAFAALSVKQQLRNASQSLNYPMFVFLLTEKNETKLLGQLYFQASDNKVNEFNNQKLLRPTTLPLTPAQLENLKTLLTKHNQCVEIEKKKVDK